MVPTAPQNWGVEFRAHCYVSFPKVDTIRLVAMNPGAYGEHDQQPPSSGQSMASQIYSSSGDAGRSLDATDGLFPVDLDLTGFSPNSGTDVSNTYRNRGGRFVPRYSFTSEYNPTKVEWEEVRLFVGNQTNDLLEFRLPLRGECDVPNQGGACVNSLYKRDVLLSTLDGTMNSFSPEEHINTVMSAISQKYNWVAGDSKNPSHLKFNYFFVGRDLASGLKVASSEGLEKTIKTSFNMRRSVNLNHNYVAGGCAGDYSTTMSSYVDTKMAEVLHYLTNDLQVETLCNDGSLPFGGRFSVNSVDEGLPLKPHQAHKDGKHLDLRYFSDQDCSAFGVPVLDQNTTESPQITDKSAECLSEGGFQNYYDRAAFTGNTLPNGNPEKVAAWRRIQDWDHTKDFLTYLNALGETNPEAKESCLADSTTCAAAMANVISGTESLEVKRKIAARNLRAMKRLSRWVVYNRRKWTALSQKFDKVQILISFVKKTDSRPEWQKNLFLNGKVVDHDLLGLGANGSALERIGSCDEDSQCDLHQEAGDNKNLRNDGGSGHIDHLHLGFF